jgi:hypothetical protein
MATPQQAQTYLEMVRKIALALPEVEEGLAYGTKAWRVRKKFLARIREDGETLVMRVEPLQRDMLMDADPDVYFVTPHYAASEEYMLVNLSKVHPGDLQMLFETAWLRNAPKTLIAAHKDRFGG